MHKKEYILMGSVLTYEVVSMLLIAYLYQILDSHLIKIIIQNVANVLSICVTLLAIKVSKKSLRDFGLFTDHLFKQILIGLVVGFILVVLLQGLSFLEASPNLYDIFSMMLVGFSEELLFRGFLFTMIYELSGSRLKAVFIPSIVFGIWHFPVGQTSLEGIGNCTAYLYKDKSYYIQLLTNKTTFIFNLFDKEDTLDLFNELNLLIRQKYHTTNEKSIKE